MSVVEILNELKKIREIFLNNLDVALSSLLRLRVYEQTFENGTTDLTVENCTQTVQSSQVYGGNYALDISIANGETGSITTPARPVSANQRVTFSFAHKENNYINSIKLIAIWRRSSGGIISTEEYDLTSSTSWQVDSRTLTAPKNAATMELQIQATTSGGEGHVYLDELTMDLVGQIFRVDGAGNLKVSDDMLDVKLSTRLADDVAGSPDTNPPSRGIMLHGYDYDNNLARRVRVTQDGKLTWSSG